MTGVVMKLHPQMNHTGPWSLTLSERTSIICRAQVVQIYSFLLFSYFTDYIIAQDPEYMQRTPTRRSNIQFPPAKANLGLRNPRCFPYNRLRILVVIGP